MLGPIWRHVQLNTYNFDTVCFGTPGYHFFTILGVRGRMGDTINIRKDCLRNYAFMAKHANIMSCVLHQAAPTKCCIVLFLTLGDGEDNRTTVSVLPSVNHSIV